MPPTNTEWQALSDDCENRNARAGLGYFLRLFAGFVMRFLAIPWSQNRCENKERNFDTLDNYQEALFELAFCDQTEVSVWLLPSRNKGN